jgi:hypothetical protein
MTPTRVTMATVALRASLWLFLQTAMPDRPDTEIDALTGEAVRAVRQVVERVGEGEVAA